MTPNENLCASDWATLRGEKWRADMAGMEATLSPVNEPLIQALQLDAPYRIAEVGCGGGGTALELLRRAPAGSVVHGFDISPALIEAARARIASAESRMAFDTADMSSAAPVDGPYDRLVSRFGIMFFSDPPAAFANLSRWLAPGGRFAFAAWGALESNAWRAIARDVVAGIIELPPAEADAAGPFRYADEGKLIALLRQAGFGEVAVQHWRGRLPVGGGLRAAEATEFALNSLSSFGELLAAAGEDATNAARRALAERLMEHEQDGAVAMEASVHIFTGTLIR